MTCNHQSIVLREWGLITWQNGPPTHQSEGKGAHTYLQQGALSMVTNYSQGAQV